jgi:hypothetical protein
LSTTYPTWIDPGANPGLRGESPETNRLSHGTAPRDMVATHVTNWKGKPERVRRIRPHSDKSAVAWFFFPEGLHSSVQVVTYGVLILLRCGNARGVPSTATIFWCIVRSPSKFQSFLINAPELSGSNQQRHLAAK